MDIYKSHVLLLIYYKPKLFNMNLFKLLLFSFSFLFIGASSYASQDISNGISTSASTHSTVVKKGVIAKFTDAAEKKIAKIVSHLPIKKEENTKLIIAILLAIILPGLGLHRVFLGGKPVLILYYFLLNFLFGFGALLSLIDIIVMIIDGNTSRFDGNDKLFAAFGR